MKRALSVIVWLLFAAPAPAWAAGPDTLPAGDGGVVAAVIDGDTVRLAGGRQDVRLVGIQAPKLPLGRKGFKPWPLAGDAEAALKSMVQDHTVALRLGTTARDRNGRVLAHLVRDDGLWIQAEMLRRGWARVYTFPDNRQLADELFAAEREARAAKRGIWGHAFYAVRNADPAALAADRGTFQVIEGRVADAAKVRGRVFLNFGTDYRSDFTATIAPEALALFSKEGRDPLAFENQTVRVRGYVRDYNGPVLDITHPEQIERVDVP
jgi:micrococcal nuclease